MICMKQLILILSFGVLVVADVYAAPPTLLSLSKAIQQHIVTVEAEATGSSYNKQALKLTIENTGSLTYNLIMDPGVIFTSDSAGFQPLILAGEEKLFMTPLKKTTITIQTFCADSRALAPLKGIKYTYSKIAGDTLVKVIDFINKNRMFNDLGQSAVWVFTNGHSLNSVYDGGNDFMSKKLLDYIVNLTHMPMPEYFVQSTVNTTAGEEVYSPKTLKIFAKFEEELESPKKLTLGIFNAQDEMIQPVFENRNYGKAGHRFRVEFEAKGVPAGKYYIRLKEGEAILRETMVEVE